MGTKIKVILYLLIVLGVGCLMVKLNMQKKDIENLTLKLTVCENNLEKANGLATSVNETNKTNNATTVKYNSMKKKEQVNEKDNDFNDLHNLDVLLEQKSIIE